MAVMTLESLVLCGVAVLVGGKAVNLRRGTGYPAKTQNSATRLTKRHPSPDSRQDFNPPADVIEPAVSDRGSDAGVGGAGRSRWRVGVSAVRSTSTPLDAPIQRGWANPAGGQRPTAAANASPCQAPVATSVGEARLGTSSLRDSARLPGRSGVGQAPCKRAGRIAMASLRRD